MFVFPIGDDVHLSYVDNSGIDPIGYPLGHYAVDGVPGAPVSGGCPEVSCVVTLDDEPPRRLAS